MVKNRIFFYCQDCGYQSPKWLGKCPSCGGWNRFIEEEVKTRDRSVFADVSFNEAPLSIDDICADEGERISTGIGEVDRVLGGGIVKGSVVLVGGDPGIGKSTLLLQVLHNLARRGMSVLYVSGEESAKQIKLRGTRIGAVSKNIFILVEIELDRILTHIKALKPAVVVVDSIQTIVSPELVSVPGSVAQVREASAQLILLSKKTGTPVFLVGHVTKDGTIAGPKILEHMVDTVLYFEGDSGHAYRIIRAMKNRFGPTNEIGVFEMRDKGLHEVSNPSAFFLTERPESAAGSVVVPSMEGTRPILVEIQSLVNPSGLGVPRRTTIGVDHTRVSLLAAVMDRMCGFRLQTHDIFVNVAGGIKVDEPAIDVGIVSSVASSFLDRPVHAGTVVFGEVGLTGEVRGISQAETRIREATRMGFRRCILPHGISRGDALKTKIECIEVKNIRELLEYLF